MAIEFIDVATYVGAAESSIVVDVPAGAVAGDLLVGIVVNYLASTARTFTTPADWNLIATELTSSWRRTSIYWKFRVAETTVEWALSGAATYTSGAIAAYRGVAAIPIDVFSDTAYTTNNATVRGASVTTTIANAMLIHAGWYAATTDTASPTDFSERVDLVATDDNHTLILSDYVQAAAGASGNKDATGYSSAFKHAFLVALAPGGQPMMARGTLVPGLRQWQPPGWARWCQRWLAGLLPHNGRGWLPVGV